MEEGNRKNLDEKSMIVEQARLEKEKKKRKHRKKKRFLLAFLLIIAAGGVWYIFWGRKLSADREATVKIEKSAGQEIVYVRLDSVRGNEIAYTIAEAGSMQEKMPEAQSAQGGMPQAQSVEDGMPEARNADGGQRHSEDTADKNGDAEASPGDRRQHGQGGSGAVLPGGEDAVFFNGAVGGSGKGGFTYDGVTYGLTGETGTAIIPVGTTVITRLGAETTFSRLQAGDYAALITEGSGDDGEIVSVYILG